MDLLRKKEREKRTLRFDGNHIIIDDVVRHHRRNVKKKVVSKCKKKFNEAEKIAMKKSPIFIHVHCTENNGRHKSETNESKKKL